MLRVVRRPVCRSSLWRSLAFGAGLRRGQRRRRTTRASRSSAATAARSSPRSTPRSAQAGWPAPRSARSRRGGGVDPREHFGVLALVIVAGSLVAGRHLLPPHADDRRPRGSSSGRREALLVLGAAAFFTLLAEGAAADWSAVYLSHSLGATAAVAALGYTFFSLAMATSRAGRRPAERSASARSALVARRRAARGRRPRRSRSPWARRPPRWPASPRWARGSAWSCPVLFRAAGSTAGVSAGVGVAAVSTIGWLGFLAGAARDRLRRRRRRAACRARHRRGRDRDGRSRWPRSAGAGRAAASRASAESCSSRAPCSPTSTACWSTRAPRSRRRGARFAARHGLDPEHVLAQSPGRRSADLIRLVAPHLDAQAEAATIEREEIEAAGGLQALPGARELVASVPPDRFAIVTSGSRALAEGAPPGDRYPAAARPRHRRERRGRQARPGRLPQRRGTARRRPGAQPRARGCARGRRGRAGRGDDRRRRADDDRRERAPGRALARLPT